MRRGSRIDPRRAHRLRVRLVRPPTPARPQHGRSKFLVGADLVGPGLGRGQAVGRHQTQPLAARRVEPRFGEMIVARFLAQPDQFLGDGAELLVEVTETTVAAQADDGLY